MIRTQLAVQGVDNCGIDTVILFDLDSTFFPDEMTRDSVLYTYSWIAIDDSGNTSDIRVVTLLISDLCSISATAEVVSEVTDDAINTNYSKNVMNPEKKDGTLGRPSSPDSFDKSRSLMLYQNYPNPFTRMTKIPFELSYATDLTLTIYDVTGKTLTEIKGTYSKGFHEVEIDRNNLPGGGIMYYRIDTEYDTQTRRMVLME